MNLVHRCGPVGAALAVMSCASVGSPMAASPDGGGAAIRVGLTVEQEQVTVRATGATTITTSSGERFEMSEGDGATITANAGGVRVREWGIEPGVSVRFSPRGRHATIMVDGAAFRGDLEVKVAGNRVTAVNLVSVEDYLPSVVGAEMGNRPESDQAALDAQAIAARTYALKNRGKNERNGFDVRADVSDQVYRGVSSETAGAWAAVRKTSGRVITYKGDLIPAFYHSTCGPNTATPTEVFRTINDVPFLTTVSDERPGGGYYNDISPYFQWQVGWTRDQITRILRETLPSVVGVDQSMVEDISGVSVFRRGPSGRAMEVHVEVGAGTIPVYGADIRSVFRNPEGNALRTNAVEFDVMTEDGVFTGLNVTGWGFGHGVGLCQWGAIGRSRAGHDYRAIIEAYYPGVSIERWN